MHKPKNKVLLLAGLTIFFFTHSSPAFADTSLKTAKSIPIQNHGRVKAFDSFSRQTVETITGREKWNKKDAVTLVLEALSAQDKVADIPWVLVNHAGLRKELGLQAERRYFSYNEIYASFSKIRELIASAKEKRDSDKSASAVEKEAESLYGSLVIVNGLITGESVRVIPLSAEENQAWLSPYTSADAASDKFKNLVRLLAENKTGEFRTEAAYWNDWVHSVTGPAHLGTIKWELLYSGLRPFQWAWVLYLAGFILLSAVKKNPLGKPAGISLVALAMAFHTLGLILRVIVLQRPPVSNMYESMVYMNWAVMLFAFIFAAIQRNAVFLTAGAAISALVMIYGDLLPIDADLEVLVPVLRSNYWLSVHVMTIVSSYGAFGLAMALGHRHLILERTKKFTKAAQETSAQLIYGVIQLGILLLGIGTVLGGVWANESWGRFWGWDPKETWALITFLAYLVVVHLKYSKKITPHWLALSSIIGFFFVLMTWYGVNFVLGRGLHSYGFGSGGMMWILAYIAAEIIFLAVVIPKK